MSATGNAALPASRSPEAGFEQPFALLAACHDRVRRSLALLQRLVAHLEAQGVDDQARSAAHDVWRYFEIAAPQHHEDEERHVIPHLLASADARCVAAANRMRADHEQLHRLWAGRLGPRLRRLHEGSGSLDLAALKDEAMQFVAIHDSHVPLEDELAFPAAQELIDAEAQVRMGREMAARRGVT